MRAHAKKNTRDVYMQPGWRLAFYDSVVNNNLETLKILVKRHKIDLNEGFQEARDKDHRRMYPMHLVAYKGYTDMLEYMNDEQCDFELTTHCTKRTALHFAVLGQKTACFHKLLSYGAKPDPRDTFKNSPCHYAAEDGSIDLLDVLIKLEADINAQDITLKTPLMKAARNARVHTVKLLIDAGCLIDRVDKHGDTALHHASQRGSAPLLRVIVAAAAAAAAAADVNIQNQWGYTPPKEAINYDNKGELGIYGIVSTRNLDTMNLLLDYNYDFDYVIKRDETRSSGGKTLIELAFEMGYFDILRLLAETGYVLSYNTEHYMRHYLSAGGAVQNAVAERESDHAAAVLQFITEIEIVPSLKQMCRKTIRKTLGFGIHKSINELPIPHVLKSYVLLEFITR